MGPKTRGGGTPARPICISFQGINAGKKCRPGKPLSKNGPIKCQLWELESAGSSPARCAIPIQKGGEYKMAKIDEAELHALLDVLGVTSRHLAETAANLAVGAVPAAGLPLPAIPPFERSFPPAPIAVPPANAPAVAAPPAAATGPPTSAVAFPPAGVPVARLLGTHAAPVSYAAPMVSVAVPVLARALGR